VQLVSPPFPAFAPAPARGRTFETTRTVRSTDVSPGGRLRLDAVARYLQEAAEDDITDAGWTPPYGWLLRRCAITVRSYPSRGDVVRLCTFCSGTGQRWAERTTTLTGPAGEAMQARAIWVAIDRASGEPVPLGPGFHRIYGESAQGHRVSARLSLPAPDGVGGGGRDWPLRASDFDTAGHVNNTIHWIAVEEALAEAEGQGEAGDRAEAGSRVETGGPAGAGGPVESAGHAEVTGRPEAGGPAETGNRVEAGGGAETGSRAETGDQAEAGDRADGAVWAHAPWLPGFAELEYHRPMLPGLLPRLLTSHEPGHVMVWLLDGGERLASARLSSAPPVNPSRPTQTPDTAS
jgi:acyl-ACP thioesterase